MAVKQPPALYEELRSWCMANRLPFLGADELCVRDFLTQAQRDWLEWFCVRWVEFMSSDEARSIQLRTGLELAGSFVSVLRDVLGEGHFGLCMTNLGAQAPRFSHGVSAVGA